jgi:hypothetical protein
VSGAGIMDALERRIVELTLGGDAAALAALYSSDALVDINVPHWRYQTTAAGVEAALREDFDVADRRVTASRVLALDGGVAVETEVHFRANGEARMWRTVHLFRTNGRCIVEHIVYCTGMWDAATVARHAAEAPMVRR